MKRAFVWFARLKNYFSQGNLYMAIANFIITLATWQAAAKINIPLWIIILIGFGTVIIIGALDFYLVKRHEIAHANTMSDMKAQLDRIEERIAL